MSGLQEFIKSMEGQTVKYGEPRELIWRLAHVLQDDLAEIRHEYNAHLEEHHGVRISYPSAADSQRNDTKLPSERKASK